MANIVIIPPKSFIFVPCTWNCDLARVI